MLKIENPETKRSKCIFYDGREEVIEWFIVPNRSVVGPFRDPVIVFKTESGIYKYEKTEYEPYEVLPKPRVIKLPSDNCFTKLCRDYGYIDVNNEDIWYNNTHIERIELYDLDRA